MNPEVKAKWLEALRSGEYNQTKRTLRDSHGYCCLGVLCEVYKEEHPEAEWVRDDISTKNGEMLFKSGEYSRKGVPTQQVLDWANLTDANPEVKYNNADISVAELNDNGKSFLEIADIIEEHL